MTLSPSRKWVRCEGAGGIWASSSSSPAAPLPLPLALDLCPDLQKQIGWEDCSPGSTQIWLLAQRPKLARGELLQIEPRERRRLRPSPVSVGTQFFYKATHEIFRGVSPARPPSLHNVCWTWKTRALEAEHKAKTIGWPPDLQKFELNQ